MFRLADGVTVLLVEIAGKRLAGGVTSMVTEFSFDEKEKESAEAKIVIVGQGGVRIDDLMPKIGARFRVRWGYLGALGDTHEMRVQSVTPTYGTETKLTITARDRGDDLGRTGGQRAWENATIRSVVEDLAKAAGLEAVLPRPVAGNIDGTPTTRTVAYPDPAAATRAPYQAIQQAQTPNAPREAKLLDRVMSLAQRGRSPRQLLQAIAAQTGCELHVEGSKLQLLPKHFAARPRVVLRWKNVESKLIEFSPKEKKAGRHEAGATATVAAGVDADTGQPFSAKANDASEKGRPVLGKESPFGGEKADGNAPGGDVVYVDGLKQEEVVRRGPEPAAEEAGKAGAYVPTPTGSAGDAAARAGAKFRDAEGGGATTSFKAVGIASIQKGRVLDIRGIDKRNSGLWMVVSSSHKIDASGYGVSGELRRHGSNTVGRGKARTKGQPNTSTGVASDEKQQAYYLVDSRKDEKPVGVVVK